MTRSILRSIISEDIEPDSIEEPKVGIACEVVHPTRSKTQSMLWRDSQKDALNQATSKLLGSDIAVSGQALGRYLVGGHPVVLWR